MARKSARQPSSLGPSQDGFDGASYRQWFDAPDVSEVRIVDIDIRGQRRNHAPLRVGDEMGERLTKPLIDWQRVADENSRFPISRGRSVAQVAVALVVTDGIQRVQHAQLVAAR